MSAHRWIDRVCIIVTVLSLIVTVLFMNGEKLGIELVSDSDAEGYAGNEYFTANDLNGNWDTSGATEITLSGDTAQISGNGAYWLDGSVVIAQSGKYVISGELTDGNIVVDAARYSKVWILLNGITVSCSNDACIRVDQADKVFLTLAEGSENTLTGGNSFSETALADSTDAVIFSHDDLTINGAGSLTVVSSFRNGMTSKDDLLIAGGTISITAPVHGLRVNDRFRMTSADVTISAEQDGIHTEGGIVIQDGTLTIHAGDDAVHSDTSVLILGGTILVSDCYEGIEALTIEISGGDTTIHSRDDGLNANGYTGMSFGGGMEMQAQMPEMSESMFSEKAMSFPGNSPADNAQAADAKESQTDSATEKAIVSVEDTWILISGGTLTVLNESGRDADGIDSNGNLTITGGTVLVSLAGSSGNSALDSGSESGGIMTISGGTVIACGDSSMAESFGSESSQVSVLYTLNETAAAGSSVTLLDAEGKELISETVPYSFSSVLISCPDMAVNETYTIRVGEAEETVEMTGVSVSVGSSSGTGMMPGGDMPGGEEMQMHPGGFGGGDTPPERPDGEEGFGFPENGEGMERGSFGSGGTPPERPDGDKGFRMPENGNNENTAPQPPDAAPDRNENAFSEKITMEEDAEQLVTTDNTPAWILVLGSVLCLVLGLAVAALYKRSQHIDV